MSRVDGVVAGSLSLLSACANGNVTSAVRVVVQSTHMSRAQPAAIPPPHCLALTLAATSNESRADDEAKTSVTAATATRTSDEAKAVPASIVPNSLLSDIQDIKAMVQALAAGTTAGAQASATQTCPEQKDAAPTVSAPEPHVRIDHTCTHHQPRPPEIARSNRPEASSSRTSSPTQRRVSVPIDPQTPPVPASSTGDTPPEHFDNAPVSDRAGASEHVNNGGHHQPRAVAQEPEVQESRTQGRGVIPASAGGPYPLRASPRERKDEEEEEERRSSSGSGRGGSGEGGPIDSEGRGGDASSLADETAAATERGDRSKESADPSQPIAKEGSSARAAAEASRPPHPSEGHAAVGVKGEVNDGGPRLLDEAPPEDKCKVG